MSFSLASSAPIQKSDNLVGYLNTFYVEFEFDYNGCHFIAVLQINDNGVNQGSLTRICGSTVQTIKFKIKTFEIKTVLTQYYCVASVNDIEWLDPLPEKMLQPAFQELFLTELNTELANHTF
jgi:hypothetical protein